MLWRRRMSFLHHYLDTAHRKRRNQRQPTRCTEQKFLALVLTSQIRSRWSSLAPRFRVGNCKHEDSVPSRLRNKMDEPYGNSIGRSSFRACILNDSLFYVYFHAKSLAQPVYRVLLHYARKQNPLDPHDHSPGPRRAPFPYLSCTFLTTQHTTSQPPPHTSAPIHTSLD